MTAFSFDVPGKIATKGSWRYAPKTERWIPDNPNMKAYCEAIQFVARRAMVQRKLKPVEGLPVTVLINLTFDEEGKPRSHEGNDHIHVPDVDKVTRAVLDAMAGTVYRDDRQVNELHVRKDWGDVDNTTIRVEFE